MSIRCSQRERIIAYRRGCASAVGVSRGRISQLETEGANLELATLAKLTHALGYDLQVQLVPKSGDGETLTATL